MKDETLDQIAPLLGALRCFSILEEVRGVAFHLNGRGFIHFHETPDGIIADVLLTRGRVSMPVSSAAEQAELLDRIESRLSALEAPGGDRRRRARGGRKRDD